MAKKKSKSGRKPVITQAVIEKLEEAFEWGCTDSEACLHAGCGRTTLYDYQAENPEFVERKNLLKEQPVRIARQAVVEALSKSPDLSLKFLERKKKDEFSLRSEVTGKDGGAVEFVPVKVSRLYDDED